jgi:hypothetical protein
MLKRNSFYSFLLLLALCACQSIAEKSEPTEGDEEGGYEKYYEETRRAALGENWEKSPKTI